MSIIERGPDGATTHLHGGGEGKAALTPGTIAKMSTSQTLFSADGRLLASVTGGGIALYDTSTNKVVREIPTPVG